MEPIQIGNKRCSQGLTDLIFRRIQEIAKEDREFQENLSQAGKSYDPTMTSSLAVNGFETRVTPRWAMTSGAKSGQGAKPGKCVHIVDVCGLHVYPQVTDLASYEALEVARRPEYLRVHGKLGG